jgi:hypothetical protein
MLYSYLKQKKLDIEVLKSFIQAGVDVNLKQSSSNLLTVLALNKKASYEHFELLINAGSNIN